MIQAFRTISITIDLGDEQKDVQIPFTVELVDKLEETIQKTKGGVFLRFRKKDKRLIEVFDEFAKPYLEGIDLKKVHPTFSALFFSRVRDELMRSISELENFNEHTEMPS